MKEHHVNGRGPREGERNPVEYRAQGVGGSSEATGEEGGEGEEEGREEEDEIVELLEELAGQNDGIDTSPNVVALRMIFEDMKGDIRFPPPWYVPIEGKLPCNRHLHVPAEQTKDGRERNFWCDLPAMHRIKEGHRMVTSNTHGRAFTWPYWSPL